MDTLTFHRLLPTLLATTVTLTAAGIAVGAGEDRGYLTAIKQELARLDMTARCDDAGQSCFITHPVKNSSTPELHLVIKYSAATDTVYLYVDRFIELTDDSELNASLATRLLALNSELVTAKFEWDRAGQAVRLSTVLNTDSNFDRRAFRSQLLGLLKVATRLWPELNAASEPGNNAQKTPTNVGDNRIAPKTEHRPSDH